MAFHWEFAEQQSKTSSKYVCRSLSICRMSLRVALAFTCSLVDYVERIGNICVRNVIMEICFRMKLVLTVISYNFF